MKQKTNKNVNLTLSDGTMELISSCLPKSGKSVSQKDINEVVSSMMINYMIMKKKIDGGYRVFIGKDESKLEYEYNMV